jgi:phosphoserine phosphatase
MGRGGRAATVAALRSAGIQAFAQARERSAGARLGDRTALPSGLGMKIRSGVTKRRLPTICLFPVAAALGALGCNSRVSAGNAAADPLPSWNNGPAKNAIREFVKTATDRKGPGFVPIEDRIATFDQDGTLWVEHPLYTQAAFALARVRELAPSHPEWKTTEPFKAVLAGDEQAIGRLSESDWETIVAGTHAGMSTEAFLSDVERWLDAARHPRFKRPYTELVYQPMLEAMRLLRENGFKTYIVTGGGQEFVRVYAARAYGVTPEQVIGSSLLTRYEVQHGKPVLLREPKVFLIDDKGGKPVAINLFIGKRPIAAFGNSSGDAEMLQWTQTGDRAPRLMMLVHHDDGRREYAYGPAGGLPDTKVGTFPYELMTDAKAGRWHVISMKNDWKRIFAFEQLAMIGKEEADSQQRP